MAVSTSKRRRKTPTEAPGESVRQPDSQRLAPQLSCGSAGPIEDVDLRSVLDPVLRGLNVGSPEDQRAAVLAVADALMNRWDLGIGDELHRIVELEAYVHSPFHEDPYTHGDSGQLSGGCWYFHKQGPSFKGGSFKGVDLACGSEDSGTRAGLLIRSIAQEGGGLVEGPSLVVDTILRLNKKTSIAEFVGARQVSELVADATEGLCLRPASGPRSERLWDAPRVGLVLRADGGKTHSKGRPSEFVARLYRFSTLPQRLAKFRSGFAASVLLAAEESGDAGSVSERLKRELGLAKASEYEAAVKKGRLSGCLTSFVGKKLDNVGICEMLGACSAGPRGTK